MPVVTSGYTGRNDTNRVRPDGGAFHGGQRTETAKDSGLPAKNLMGQPWRVAFALQDDGWILRSAIVWHKPNPMPEPTRDRPTSAYEMVFLLAKQARYFYDAEAVRESPNKDSLPLGMGFLTEPLQFGWIT